MFVGVAAACGPGESEEKTIVYTATALENATVGTAYSASLATATGADGIVYALKSGMTPPSGLTLSSAGVLSGTPTAEAANAKFTVVASAEGAKSAEAEFTLTVTAVVPPPATEGFVMEAEFANLDKLTNVAGSFSPRTFRSDAGASGGKYLGDLGKAGCTVQYDFTSSAAGSATLEVFMKSCITDNIVVASDVLQINVNGTNVTYTGTTLPSGATTFSSFTVNITLVSGANTIKFVTTDNQKYLLNASPVMPHFDCITIKDTTAELSWEPREDNEDNFS